MTTVAAASEVRTVESFIVAVETYDGSGMNVERRDRESSWEQCDELEDAVVNSWREIKVEEYRALQSWWRLEVGVKVAGDWRLPSLTLSCPPVVAAPQGSRRAFLPPHFIRLPHPAYSEYGHYHECL